MLLKYTAAWIPMVILAILNGALREFGYKPLVGDLAAHQLSTLTLIIITFAYFWFLNTLWRITDTKTAAAIGAIWFSLTVLFEFVFGHYVMGHPWARLFADYNLLKGRIWSIVLIWIAVLPYVVYKFKIMREQKSSE